VLLWRRNEDAVRGKLAHDLQGPGEFDVVVPLGLEDIFAAPWCGNEDSLCVEKAKVADQAIVGHLVDPFDELFIGRL
jgi:hypothetical protein